MDKFKDIWEDRFNTDDHSKDDWLQPSSAVFANVSAAVLPTQPSKKKLAWFWWVLIGAAVITTVGIGYRLISNDNATEDVTLYQTAKYATEKNISSEQGTVDEAISDKRYEPNSILMTEVPQQQISSTETVRIEGVNRNNISLNNEIAQSTISTSDFNSLEDVNTPLMVEEKSTSITPIKETVANNPITNKAGYLSKNMVTVLPLKIAINELESDNQLIDIPSDFTRINIQKKQIGNKRAFALHAQTGLAIQNAQLNDAFSNSLDNADFSSSAGVGYYAGLGLNIPINNRWSLTTDINYTHTTSVASHNANLGYDINRETADDHTNDYNIGMATPYGLIESNIVIGRSDALDSDLVSTVADVSSDQSIRAINIAPSLVYNAYSSRFINLELKTGFGIEQILSVDNHIHDVMTNYNGLNYQQGEVIKTQDEMSINNTIGQATAGFNIGVKLSSSSMLLLGYEYQKALNPIFQMDDKKTYLNNQNIGIKFRINL